MKLLFAATAFAASVTIAQNLDTDYDSEYPAFDGEFDKFGRGGRRKNRNKNREAQAPPGAPKPLSRKQATEIYLRALDKRAALTGNAMDRAFANLTRYKSATTPLPNYILEYIRDNNNGAGLRAVDLNCEGEGCEIPMSLAGIWGYGCWCNFGADLMKGQGPALNAHDEICQSMQLCLRCAQHDADEDGSYSCNPKTQEFKSVFRFGDRELIADCEAENPDDPCAVHMCTCELNLVGKVIDLVWTGYVYDPSLKHPSNGGSFDYEAMCPQTGFGQDAETACCGYYPDRSPFSVGGSRECCDDDGELFNPLSEQCCEDTGVQELGDIC